ncbi:clathrin light chain [Echinococcus granulosus]|uniref:Clathrin light chain n=1 Tax=Echinococcus granulosus TaxID=6210 RepID=W6UXL0_ECHGR|nr:clathrin light chain [Echinococcus granulosus]EUB58299.1 clathrin light chain [Echinococcus granulosus]
MAGDRVSAFLAREKESLGDLTDELFNGTGSSSDLDFSEGSRRDGYLVNELEESEVVGAPDSALPVTAAESTFSTSDQHVNRTSQRKTSSPASVTKAQESAILESWRVNFEADIKARDEKEAAKRTELEANAKRELETWYSHYRQQMALRSADNRMDAPRDASGKAYDGFSGQAPSVRDTAVWESVCGMCDLTASLTNSQRQSTPRVPMISHGCAVCCLTLRRPHWDKPTQRS